MKNFPERILKSLASIKLAVIVIISLAVISTVGTIYEARYNDAEVAQKLVYHSPWMALVMVLLCINLIAVMVDRWPWKKHHIGFVTAHIGILTLLFGAYLTYKFGVDGSMVFNIGESNQNVTVKERDLYVFASLDGNSMKNMFEAEVDFLKSPPTPENPFLVNLGSDVLKFVEYHHFAYRESEIAVSEDESDGPAIRFQLENANVNVTEWLKKERLRERGEVDLGPAKVVLAKELFPSTGRNEVIFVANPDRSTLNYWVRDKSGVIKKTGVARQSDTIETGWMGLKLRVLRYLPSAREVVKFIPASKSTPVTTSAAKFIFNGQEHWLGLNSVVRLFLKDRSYMVSFGNRRLDLTFPLKLLAFRVGMYQGTQRAESYESDVEVPGRGSVLISMNEPLKHNGYTFYQSSFERNEQGQPVISILSVNKDPGRWIKYLGSLLIVLGAIDMFYFKRVRWLKKGSAK